MKINRSALAVCAIAASLLTPCQALAKKVDVRGEITSLTRNDSKQVPGFLMVEGNKTEDTSVDKASVRVTDKTEIFKSGTDKKATFGDLKKGQTVEVNFVGPVAESYPVQAAAGKITILTGD